MSFFARPIYVSELTQFLEEFKAANPELEQAQRDGRALLWERKTDDAFNAAAQAANVPQQPYVYQPKPDRAQNTALELQ